MSLLTIVMAQQNAPTVFNNNIYIHQEAQVTVFNSLKNTDSSLYNDGHLTLLGDSLINEATLQGTGTLELAGTQEQHITHGGLIIVDSLILNNSFNISFNNNMIINEHLAFINGILYDNYDTEASPDDLPAITFSAKADYDTTLVNHTAYIEGLVRKEGRTRFIFPVGDLGTYRPVVADNIASDNVISAHYYYEWVDYPEESIEFGLELLCDEYWYINGKETGYDITLTYDASTSDLNTDDDETDVKIVSYDKRFDSRYRIIDVETTEVMQQLSYKATPQPTDTAFVWYGFAQQLAISAPEGYDLYVPQMLTPNGDGKNDRLKILGITEYPDNNITIINRYGRVVFEMDRYDNSWEGTSKNRQLPTGTYWVFFYSEGKLIYKDYLQLLQVSR